MVIDPDTVLPAVLATRLRGRRLVVDVHEDYLALLADRGWARSWTGDAARHVARGASYLARRADLTVVADAHVPPLRARRRLVVRNLPDLASLPEPGPLDAVPRAIYIGDVRRSRGLQDMVAAVEAAPPWRLDIVGPVAAEDAVWLADHPTSPRIRAHGRLPLHRAWALARGAWVGMCLLEDTPAFREAVPTKIYEYLGCGLALLTSPLPRISEIVASSGGGQVVADQLAASRALAGWYADPHSLEETRAAARRWAEANLTGPSPFEALADEIEALVSECCGGPRRPPPAAASRPGTDAPGASPAPAVAAVPEAATVADPRTPVPHKGRKRSSRRTEERISGSTRHAER
jgi:glycosyltransferase involved in cell wall biosynthesis